MKLSYKQATTLIKFIDDVIPHLYDLPSNMGTTLVARSNKLRKSLLDCDEISDWLCLTPIQKKAIKHYDKMIAWAKQQLPNACVNNLHMLDAVKAHWSAEHCVYCAELGCVCHKCPLLAYTSTKTVGDNKCCAGLWTKMNKAKTWKSWIYHAEKVRDYIVRYGYYKK